MSCCSSASHQVLPSLTARGRRRRDSYSAWGQVVVEALIPCGHNNASGNRLCGGFLASFSETLRLTNAEMWNSRSCRSVPADSWKPDSSGCCAEVSINESDAVSHEDPNTATKITRQRFPGLAKRTKIGKRHGLPHVERRKLPNPACIYKHCNPVYNTGTQSTVAGRTALWSPAFPDPNRVTTHLPASKRRGTKMQLNHECHQQRPLPYGPPPTGDLQKPSTTENKV